MEEYSVTIIQDEAVPMAGKLKPILDYTDRIMIITLLLLLVIVITYYLILCNKKEKKVLDLISMVDRAYITYNRFNYFRLTAIEQELRYQVMELQLVRDD